MVSSSGDAASDHHSQSGAPSLSSLSVTRKHLIERARMLRQLRHRQITPEQLNAALADRPSGCYIAGDGG